MNFCASTTACASRASTTRICFLSIHADTISLKGIRGATVYTVSDKASDADAKALADRENLSDQLAGHRGRGRRS